MKNSIRNEKKILQAVQLFDCRTKMYTLIITILEMHLYFCAELQVKLDKKLSNIDEKSGKLFDCSTFLYTFFQFFR